MILIFFPISLELSIIDAENYILYSEPEMLLKEIPGRLFEVSFILDL